MIAVASAFAAAVGGIDTYNPCHCDAILISKLQEIDSMETDFLLLLLLLFFIITFD